MKTEKFTIGKRSDFVKVQETFVFFSTKFLKNWTDKQLKKYVNEPVVIPVGNHGFFVGPYRITGITKNCWTVNQLDNKHVHDFVTKTNAILFCLRSMQNSNRAKEILDLDKKLGKLDNDIAFYKHTVDTTRDKLKNAIALNRYIDAKLQRRNVLNILKKTLISAKYLNFGK